MITSVVLQQLGGVVVFVAGGGWWLLLLVAFDPSPFGAMVRVRACAKRSGSTGSHTVGAARENGIPLPVRSRRP